MLEDECFQIDIRLALEIAKKTTTTKKNSNVCASINNTFKEYVDNCTDLTLTDMDIRIGKIFDEIWFISDAIQMQLLRNPDVEAMIKQMYANRLLELQTKLTKKVN